MLHILTVHPRSTHSWDGGDGNLKRRQYTVLRFFQLLKWTSERKSVDTHRKSAWKLVQLPNLKVIQRAKFRQFTDVCMVGAMTQMSVKFRDFVMHVISSLVFKLGNFANFKALFSVVLMDFPYSSMKKKIEKHRGRAYLWVFQYYPLQIILLNSVTPSPWIS